MNQIVLFAGGLLLGVLISMAFLMRNENVSVPAQHSPIEVSVAQPSIPTPYVPITAAAAEVLKPVVAPQAPVTFVAPVVPTAPALAATSPTTSTPPAAARPKWVPGKAGTFGSFEQNVNSVTKPLTKDIAPVNMENLSRKEQNQLKRQKVIEEKQLGDYLPGGADSSTLTKKQIKAAIQLKKKQQKNSVENTNAGAPATPITATSTTSTSTSTPTTTSGADAKALANAKANAMVSTYASPAIQKAVSGYHAQAERAYTGIVPYIPTYSAAAAAKLPLPDMSLQKGAFEKDNLKLHLCNSQFEAYSASYLTTKAHMIAVGSETYNLTWVNCEMASFIHMKTSAKFYNHPQEEGVIMQSLDVLDFSVIHLSAYERSSHKHRDTLWKNRKDMIREWSNIDPVIAAGKRLAHLNNPLVRTRNVTYLPEALRTVVVMPFLGGAMGAGHSKLNNRYEYLRTCFWSLFEYFPHIVAGVTRQEDVDWCMKESGLPFFEAILMPTLPKSAGLPVGLTQQTKKRLQDGRWDFDYVFFTESDQILISRELPLMYAHLKTYPGHMLIPHRLMPYSNRVMAEAHKRSISTIEDGAWTTQSCCMPRQNCGERKSWLPVADPKVPVINYYGLYVPLGNVNFLAESYRYCSLGDYVGEKAYCP